MAEKVRILPDRVANQIAAGEVIERPAAVIKELVENALDAGATRIEVEFRHGGRALMRIEDNGHGMSQDNALLALERHATSKIAEAADLDQIGSYGFRGEALPSIASVSRFELQTRERGAEEGTEILINAGRIVHVRECGRPVGTRIVVTHLFNSVPARRKFLKTDQTEAAHIIQCVRLYALASPQAAFTLIEDGRVIFKSPECATLAERVAEIFGRQTAEALVPIDASEGSEEAGARTAGAGGPMRLRGLIGRPGVGRATRHEMVIFVNQRPVNSRTLNYALIESYHESLPKGRYPLAFLFFECAPAAVDVNVHPAKREVRFRSEPAVRGFVIRSVLARLRELGAEFGSPASGEAQAPPTPAAAVPVLHSAALPQTGGRVIALSGEKAALPAPQLSPFTAPRTVWPAGAVPPSTAGKLQPFAPVSAYELGEAQRLGHAASRRGGRGESPDGAAKSALLNKSSLDTALASAAQGPGHSITGSVPNTNTLRLRFVGVVHGAYALFETAAGLLLLDRRAATERVWFERLQAQFRNASVPSQRLLLAVPLELDPIATALLLDRLSFLAEHGVEVNEFGRNFFRIEAVPTWMEPAEAEGFVRDFLGQVREGRFHENNLDLMREELARLAISRAVRLPTNPSEEELRALLDELFATSHPLTSPAGRPTYVELSHTALARLLAGL
ncbi:DNA mismatch repair protein MutL [Cephaloticoccus capnophilus]|uniref:DNA mismatch repair protein MutL n=1 Tax=Cephaloticoccus capnophilus TaxID=1548208 RepID=A0A139SRP5_9BACT|nr:DNA mismatch repair endonuclease MutL [Cephaloticoccus capnophilus]KXU37228.1 DNA mismatch repair protein MutL [Cephaloticoccus capnophilus]